MPEHTKMKPSKKANSRKFPSKAVIRRYGSDSYKYCEKERFTIVEGELPHGEQGVDRIVFRYCPMKWSNTGKQLTAAERKKVFQATREYLDKKKIKWKFSYWR